MRWTFVAALALGFWGCASLPPLTLQAPIGPAAGSRASIFQGREGVLEVFTETESVNDGGIVYHRHTPYAIYTLHGRPFRNIQNHTGQTDQRPMKVPLPAGEYRLYARAEGYGRVALRVVVAGSRLTQVFLERGGNPSLGEKAGVELARLPDGRPIGVRAAEGPAEGAPKR